MKTPRIFQRFFAAPRKEHPDPRRPATSIEPLEPRIAPAAMIELAAVRVLYPDVAVPGDHVVAAVEIKNTGDLKFSGFRGLHLYLSTDLIFDGGDLLLGELPDVPLNLKPGQGKTVGIRFTLPEMNLPTPDFPSGTAFLIAELRKDGAGVDLEASNGFPHVFQFGTVGFRKNVVLRGEDADGTGFSFGLRGLGTGTLALAGGIVDLSYAGTDATSDAVAGSGRSKTSDTFVTVRNITGGMLDTLLMPGVDVTGNVSFAGGVDTVVLHDVGTLGGADRTMELGPLAGKRVIMHRVANMDLHFGGTIDSLTVADWTNSNGDPDTISAGAGDILGTVSSKGDTKMGIPGNFQASVDLANGSFHKAKIAGTLSNVTWKAEYMFDVFAQQIEYTKITARILEKVHLTGSVKNGTLGHILSSDITLTGSSDTDILPPLSVKTTGRLWDFEIDAQKTHVAAIEADDWQNGRLLAKSLHKLDLNGDRRTSVRGDLFSVGIGLADPDASAGKLDVEGPVIGCQIITDQKLGFAFGGIFNSTINAANDITSFAIAAPAKASLEDVLFSTSNVNAPLHTIGSVTLHNVKSDGSDPAFGITADFIKSYKRSAAGVVVFRGTKLGDFSTPDTAGSYRLTIN